MRFRLRAFGIHFLGSLVALTLVLGLLYAGWYRWPGWYLTGAPHIIAIMVPADLILGPSLTLCIASSTKRRRELTRDIGVIVAIQVVALAYGAATLWQGRPLYYAFSFDRLQLVQASDLEARDVDSARKLNPGLAPHWYSTPRWVWAPLPSDEALRRKIMVGSIFGGADVVQMPQFFRPWTEGRAALRKRLRMLKELRAFTKRQQDELAGRLTKLGISPDSACAIVLTGPGTMALAVFAPSSMQLRAILAPAI